MRFLRWHKKCIGSRLDLLVYQAEGVRSATTGSDSGGSGTGCDQSCQQSQEKKRHNHRGGRGDSNEGDDADRPDPKRRKPLENDKSESLRKLFACPYFQHDPETYIRWRCCPGPGWATVHRVKYIIART